MSDAPNSGVREKSTNEDTVVQLYWAVLEAWNAQVDSYWTRTNYFAAFELAAIAGSWFLFEDDKLSTHPLLLVGLIVGVAVTLTGAWIFSNLKSYDYHKYWWDVLGRIEGDDRWFKPPDYVSKYEERRYEKRKRPILKLFSYSGFTNWVVPLGFLAVWTALIAVRLCLRH